jgi:DNA-binding NtrC family response regulator
MKKRVLIVDDEPNIRDSLKLLLGRIYDVDVAEGGDDALKALTMTGSDPITTAELPDVVILDVMMPGVDGISTLEQLRAMHPMVPVIMLTASKTVKTAVQAMKYGAVDYLSKPFDVDELLSLIEETIEKGSGGRSAPSAIRTFEYERPMLLPVDGDYGCIVGENALMREIYQTIDQIAGRDTTVLITGESGTGKELVAREIHQRSKRKEGPFVAINCAAIPESLIESELFGHEKGAFTHAVEKRIGYFEDADGGTLFLDEIGELNLSVQVKLLRFLQEQEFYRVGKSKPVRVNVRILAATNRNLETAIKEGSFRQDLFYRVNVVSMEMPPLRSRVEDIPRLMEHFVKRMSPLYSDRNPRFTDEAKALFLSYDWPGNVRELENVIESLLALCDADEIGPNDLPLRLRERTGSRREIKDDVIDGFANFEEAERAFETEIIMRALHKSNFVQTKAAELLGISRRILKYKMDKLGIADGPG